MGVPGLWDILRPAGEQRALTHLAVVDGFQRNPSGRRGLRVGIDASIWFYHATYGREGENPELRTLFFRCARLMRTTFLPLFVFDGPARPGLKRKKKVSGKDHWMVTGMCEIIEAFGFEWRMAPGEAEAELAYLNRVGIIDAIITDDVDTFVFGATTVIRNPGKLLTGNSAHPVRNAAGKDDGEHAYVYRSSAIASNQSIALTHGGLILVALLRGGDYDPEGLPGCGPGAAHGLAKAGFGDTLLNAARTLSPTRLHHFLDAWRDELRAELKSNSRGLLGAKKGALSRSLPDTFPNLEVLKLYTSPLTSETTPAGSVQPGSALEYKWDREPDLGKLAALCERKFEWGVKPLIIKRFRTVIWEPAVLRILRRAVLDLDMEQNPEAGGQGPATPRKRRLAACDDDGQSRKYALPSGTPSKMIAKHFSSLNINESDDDDEENRDDDRLILKIYSKRAHPSTDGVLEYRLEIAPAQLVRLAESGIQGTRPMPPSFFGKPTQEQEDSENSDPEDEDDSGCGSEDDSEGGASTKKKKGVKGKKKKKASPTDPAAPMRVWMPACMIKHVEPALVEAFEEQERKRAEKKARKGTKSKTTAKVNTDAVEPSESGSKAPAKAKTKKKEPTSKTKEKKHVAQIEEEEEEELSVPEDFSDVFGLANRKVAKTKAKMRVKKVAKSQSVAIEEEEDYDDDELPPHLKAATTQSRPRACSPTPTRPPRPRPELASLLKPSSSANGSSSVSTQSGASRPASPPPNSSTNSLKQHPKSLVDILSDPQSTHNADVAPRNPACNAAPSSLTSATSISISRPPSSSASTSSVTSTSTKPQSHQTRPFPIFFNQCDGAPVEKYAPRRQRTRTPSPLSTSSRSNVNADERAPSPRKSPRKSPRARREQTSPTSPRRAPAGSDSNSKHAEKLARAKARAGLKPLEAARARIAVGAKRDATSRLASAPRRDASATQTETVSGNARSRPDPALIVLSDSSGDEDGQGAATPRAHSPSNPPPPLPSKPTASSASARTGSTAQSQPKAQRVDAMFRSLKPARGAVDGGKPRPGTGTRKAGSPDKPSRRGGIPTSALRGARVPLARVNMDEVVDLD